VKVLLWPTDGNVTEIPDASVDKSLLATQRKDVAETLPEIVQEP